MGVKTEIIKPLSLGERLELEGHGYRVASAIAFVLYKEFEAEQVILFGSMRDCEFLSRDSDIDLALVGGSPERVGWGDSRGLFAAVNLAERVAAYCHEVYSLPLFEIDLLLWSVMKPRMQRQIRKGTVLGAKSFIGSRFVEDRLLATVSSV